METELKPEDTVQVFVTMKARPETTMFDWLRMVEELNFAMSNAIDEENWNSFHIYGSSSDAFEKLPQVCHQARMTYASMNGLREYLAKQTDWLLPVGIHVAARLI